MFSSVCCTMVFVLKHVVYWWVIFFLSPLRDIRPPAESEGMTDDYKVTCSQICDPLWRRRRTSGECLTFPFSSLSRH